MEERRTLMNYQNAKKGIGQIYKAELLTIIATIIGIIGAIVFLAAGEKGSEGGMAAGGIPILIAGIMFIIAFIINLVGLSNASKDEPYFKTAWIIALIAIAASVVQSILDMRGIKVEWLFELISNICEIMIMIFVITGIGKIADQLGKKKVSRLSRSTMNVTCGVYILSAIVTLIGDLFEAKAMTTVASVIAIIAGILSIIAYVYYLRTLSQGSKMFD